MLVHDVYSKICLLLGLLRYFQVPLLLKLLYELHSLIAEGMIEGSRLKVRPRMKNISQIMKDAPWSHFLQGAQRYGVRRGKM